MTARRPTARGIALAALQRIDQGAFANLVLPALLDSSGLDTRDRAFATELAYGTTRRRRSLDWLLDRHVRRPLDGRVRNALRLGAYQLAFLDTPPHAAVAATVNEVPARARGLVNAVLRRVAAELPPMWPDLETELSYPTWIVERLTSELGQEAALGALRQMNEPPPVDERGDGYIQDRASQWVAELVGVRSGDVVADLCSAPGGKATAMAAGEPRLVVAADVLRSRTRLVQENVTRLGAGRVVPLVADARRPPLRSGVFDRVLVDAPCSGLGVLRRRPDARWRVQPEDVERLATRQRAILQAAITLVRPGGVLVYSVCTLTAAESLELDRWLARAHPHLEALPPPRPPWEPYGRGARLLPQSAGTDGMYVVRLRSPGE